MATNFLKLNADKTEFIILGTPQKLSVLNSPQVKIGECEIEASTED